MGQLAIGHILRTLKQESDASILLAGCRRGMESDEVLHGDRDALA